MDDDFNDSSTIDFNYMDKPGYNWYFAGPGSALPTDGVSIANSILTIKTGGATQGWSLCSCNLWGANPTGYTHGYFEARLRFNPALGPISKWSPSWWLFSVAHSLDSTKRFAELDIFEAFTGGYKSYGGYFIGTVHDTWNGATFQNSNNSVLPPAGTNFNQWHTYGLWWETGVLNWYFDDKLMITVTYSQNGQPNPPAAPTSPSGAFWSTELEPRGMLAILGSSEEWPLEVDAVRIWQKGAGNAVLHSVNAPNPVRCAVAGRTLRYSLAKPCFVSVRLHDLQGRAIGSFVNKYQAPGNYAVQLSGILPARKVYVAEFSAGDNFTKREVLTVR
ncbi:MAG: glycoside hydrolase family 16 protein [Chitinivibrionales bacterium]|nr:glycoside hydrolase family 16 protein [Chitinivibrionales bacterium]